MATASGKAPPDNTIDGVRRWVQEQGYELEHEAQRYLKAAGFSPVLLGITYRGPGVDDKTREVDVVARCALTSPIDIRAVVECKRSSAAWVVRAATLSSEQFRWSPIASQDVASATSKRWMILQQSLVLPDGPIAFDVVQAHRKPGDINTAYAAMQQVVDAAAGLRLNATRFRPPYLLYPILVVDAPIYRLSYALDGSEELTATESERVVWGGSSWGAPVALDIVSRSAFEAHAKRLRFEFGQLAENLEPRL